MLNLDESSHSSAENNLLKQSANRVLFLTSKLWRQFQMAEQTQRVARKLGRKSAKHLREYYCLGPPAALQPFRQVYLKLSCDTEGKKKKRQTALAAYGILLVKITQLRSFKQFWFESFTSITSGRMQIQACTLCTQPLWLSFSLCQCDSCIAKELL